MKTVVAIVAFALATPAQASCVGMACSDTSGNVFTVAPQPNGDASIQGFNSQTGQQFTGTQFNNGVTIITPVPQGLPPLPLIGAQK